MGGDHGCGVVIEGAKLALQANKNITTLYLVGNEAAIHAAIRKTLTASMARRALRKRVRTVSGRRTLPAHLTKRRTCSLE